MRNLNKKQNLVEQARINLDKEKIAHSITQVRVEELESIIKEAREYIKENMSYIEKGKLEYIPSGEELLEILDKAGSDKEW